MEEIKRNPQDLSSIRDTSLRVSPRRERGGWRRLRLLNRQSQSLSVLTALATVLVEGDLANQYSG